MIRVIVIQIHVILLVQVMIHAIVMQIHVIQIV
jgi:hypothetical protein